VGKHYSFIKRRKCIFYAVKKIIFEKNDIIKLYKVTKIKGYEKINVHTVHLYTLHCK